MSPQNVCGFAVDALFLSLGHSANNEGASIKIKISLTIWKEPKGSSQDFSVSHVKHQNEGGGQVAWTNKSFFGDKCPEREDQIRR